MLEAWEKKPAWPDTEERFVEEAAEPEVAPRTPARSSSSSFSFVKSLKRSFYLSFSCSTDSTTVTARFRLTKFAVPASLTIAIYRYAIQKTLQRESNDSKSGQKDIILCTKLSSLLSLF